MERRRGGRMYVPRRRRGVVPRVFVGRWRRPKAEVERERRFLTGKVQGERGLLRREIQGEGRPRAVEPGDGAKHLGRRGPPLTPQLLLAV